MAKRILAVVSEPVSADALRSAIGENEAAGAEVLVVAPALSSRKRFLLADPDPGIETNWLEEGLVEDAKERFEPPVRHLVVGS